MKKKKHTKSKSVPKIKQAKRTKKLSPIITVPLILISLFVLTATVYKIIEIISTANSTTNFPKLEISLTEVPIEQIDVSSKDIEYPGNTATLTINGERTTFNDVEIKGRGNSTWTKAKKPYQIKFSQKVNLFNYGEAKKWILLANYLDHSYLRNDLAYKIANIVDNNFAISGNFIEVDIDNSYHGLYYLTEKVEIDKSRVNLSDLSGVLIELDLHNGDGEDYIYFKNNAILYIKDLVNYDNYDSVKANIIDSFQRLEEAISIQNFHTIAKIIDIDSFVKYYLISEFTANSEAYTASFFFYKNGIEDLIHAGPNWDFDLAFSSSPLEDNTAKQNISLGQNFDNISNHYSPNNTVVINNPKNQQKITTLLYDLMDIPEFETKVKEIYQSTLSGHKEDLLNYIKSQADYIRPAALRDQERWKLKTNFDEEVDYLIDWVSKRYDHFEEVYGQNPTESTPTPAPESPQPEPEQPAPQD